MKNILEYRKEFPVAERSVFLNHAGVSPICKRAADEIHRWIQDNYDAVPAKYKIWSARMEKVRESVAAFINAKPSEIAFVKNTSHGVNSIARAIDWKPGDNVISYGKEFPANHYPWWNLAPLGVELKLLGDREGRIAPEDLRAAIDSRTRLVSLSSVEFSTGFRNDLEALGAICREKGVMFFVDGIQSLGALRMDVRKCDIDFLAADAHKWLLGPEGIGILYVRESRLKEIKPAYIGWNSMKEPLNFWPYHYELKDDASIFEEGSHNVAGILAMGGVIELLEEIGMDRIEARIIEITDYLVEGLKKIGRNTPTPRSTNAEKSGIVMFESAGDPMKTVVELASKNIYISARSGMLRASPHFYNDFKELDTLLKSLSAM